MIWAQGEDQRQHNLFPRAWGSSQSVKQNKCPSSTYSLVLESIILSGAKDTVELVVRKAMYSLYTEHQLSIVKNVLRFKADSALNPSSATH